MSYDPAVALDFFKSAGKPTAVKKTQVIFAENEKNRLFQRSKIYLVLDGEVSLVAGKKVLGSVKPGVFSSARSSASSSSAISVLSVLATAVALRRACVSAAISPKISPCLTLPSTSLPATRLTSPSSTR